MRDSFIIIALLINTCVLAWILWHYLKFQAELFDVTNQMKLLISQLQSTALAAQSILNEPIAKSLADGIKQRAVNFLGDFS
jgi:hypothetical protein